jgi:hypothetical protein
LSDHAAPDAPVTGEPYDIIVESVRFNWPSSDEPFITDELINALEVRGYTIAPAGDVLTAEDRAAIGRMWNWAEAESADAYELDPQTESDMARIRALAAGGQS